MGPERTNKTTTTPSCNSIKKTQSSETKIDSPENKE